MNEHEQFLSDLGNDQDNKAVDVLDQPLVQDGGQDTVQVDPNAQTQQNDAVINDNDDDDGGLKPRNRRERRLMRKLDAEREASIFLAGKLEAQSEAKRIITEESDYLKAVERIYGNETPEAILATDLLKKAIIGAREDAKRDAIAEFEAKRERELAEAKKAESELENIIDDIEDNYNVNLTEAQEKSFVDLLKKMSPKDAGGRIIQYANADAVWEIFQDRLQNRGTVNKAKVLSSRSMVQGQGATQSTVQEDAHARFLKENGIL